MDHESTRSELAGAKISFEKDDSRALLEHKSIKPKNKARNYPQSRRIQNHKMAKKAVKAATMHRMRPTQTRGQQLPFALLSGPKGFIEKLRVEPIGQKRGCVSPDILIAYSRELINDYMI